jgi:hypothetical protein
MNSPTTCFLTGQCDFRLTFASYDAEIRGSDVAHVLSGGVKVSW